VAGCQLLQASLLLQAAVDPAVADILVEVGVAAAAAVVPASQSSLLLSTRISSFSQLDSIFNIR
jgi:hypothetical protein